jgi:hypothetical protein
MAYGVWQEEETADGIVKSRWLMVGSKGLT